MNMKIFISLILSLLLIGISIAGNRHHSIPDDKYIEYGKRFDCVKRIVIKDNNGKQCDGSCVFINQTSALTSAHMITGSNCIIHITDNKTSVSVDTVIIYKGFKQEFGKHDIAILKIKEPNPFDISAYPDLYRNKDELGKQSAFGGYGITGNGIRGYYISDTQLRFGTNIVDQIIDNMLCCTFSKDNQSIMEFIITPGDSGGGMFIDSKLAGINSCILAMDKKADGSYGDLSCHTRVSDYVEWIDTNSK